MGLFSVDPLAPTTMWFNAREAEKNRSFQADMSNTSHQRETKDLIAAGLNPVLSANGGASTPSGSSASSSASGELSLNKNDYIAQKAAIDQTKSAKSLNEKLGEKAQADTNSAKQAALKTIADRKIAEIQADLLRPEQIKANAMEEMYKIHPSAAIMGAIGGKITGGATGLAASTINAITEAAEKATKTTARGSAGGYKR